jgi:hypothetical protein
MRERSTAEVHTSRSMNRMRTVSQLARAAVLCVRLRWRQPGAART